MTTFEGAARKAAKRAVRDMIRNKPLKAEAMLMPFADAIIDAAFKTKKSRKGRK